jgi:tetratricopeptide (TPR) repeat protein
MKRPGWRSIGLLLLLLPSLVGSQEAESPRDALARGTTRLEAAIARYDDDEIVAAADLIRSVLSANPRFAEAHVRLGEALLWLGDLEGAEASFVAARNLRYRAVDLPLLEAQRDVLAGDLRRAETRYRDILAGQPYNEQARIGLAILELSAGPSESALARLEELAARFPENRRLVTALVQLMADRDDQESLRRYLGLALQYHGDSAGVQLLAAELALDEGRLEAAAFHGNNAIALAPKLTRGWLVLAQTAAAAGDVGRARQYHEELIRLDPTNHAAWYARGEFFAREQRLEEARRSWEHALELRPDFELARFALENTVITARDLEDPLREQLAAVYRRSGRELEERFLSRQAERHYRRGLQLNPFDPVLRARLARLYLQQGMHARYLAELRLIDERGLTTTGSDGISRNELEDRIDLFSARLRSSPAVRWQIDQFTAPRPRTTIFVSAVHDQASLLPGAERHIAAYVAALLQTSQNISVLETIASGASQGELIRQARSAGADELVVLRANLQDRSVDLSVGVVRTDNARVLVNTTIRRSGNQRLDAVAREAAEAIDGRILPRGTVLERRFEEVAVSIGSVDGVAVGDGVRFRSSVDGTDLGEGTVTAVDDLMAIVEYVPAGPDNLTVNDIALPVETAAGEDGEEQIVGDDSDSPAADQQQLPLQTPSGLVEFVQNLFQLR